MDFFDYINLIKSYATKECFVRGRHCFEVEDYYVSFWVDDYSYLDRLQFMKKGSIFWEYSKPEEFVSKYLN